MVDEILATDAPGACKCADVQKCGGGGGIIHQKKKKQVENAVLYLRILYRGCLSIDNRGQNSTSHVAHRGVNCLS